MAALARALANSVAHPASRETGKSNLLIPRASVQSDPRPHAPAAAAFRVVRVEAPRARS